MGDEELAPVRIGTGIGHGDRALFMNQRIARELVVECIPGSAAARSGRIAALDDEVGDDAVKGHPIVEPFSGEKDEVVDRLGRVTGIELQFDNSPVCLDGDAIDLPGVDLHGGRLIPLFRGHGVPPGVREIPASYGAAAAGSTAEKSSPKEFAGRPKKVDSGKADARQGMFFADGRLP